MSRIVVGEEIEERGESMSVEEVLKPVIEQEFAKYEKSGQKVKLRSIMKDRMKYTFLCLVGAWFCFPIAAEDIPVTITTIIHKYNLTIVLMIFAI